MNNNSPEPITTPVQAQEKPEIQATESNVNQVANETTSETSEDPNWRAFRDARKKDRIEREAAEKRAAEKEAEVAALKAAMEAAFSKSAPSPQAYQQYYGTNTEVEETEDQRIEKKVAAALANREMQYLKDAEAREMQEYPNRLKQTYPDFNQAVSQENLDYLDYHYPEVSRPLQRLKEGYEKWSDIYLAVKKFVPNHSNMKKDLARAEANALKPKSMSATGMTQTQPQGSHILSEDRKASNWARMQASLKGISS